MSTPGAAQRCVTSHTAYITDRGGRQRVFQPVQLSQVKWGRKLSNASSASITVSGAACRRQMPKLMDVTPRRHELVIYRGGERVWEGPIVDVRNKHNEVTIAAQDVVEYLAGTTLSKYWPNSEDGGTDNALERVRQIITHELTEPYTAKVGGAAGALQTFQRWEQLTPPANVLPYLEVRTGELLTNTITLPFEMTVAEHLLNLSKVGLSFTTIGRKLLVWDSSQSIGQIRRLSDADFNGDLDIYMTGTGFAAVQHVVGQVSQYADPADADNVGTAGAVDPYYGAWTSLETHQEEGDQDVDLEDALSSQAERLYAARKILPTEITMPSGASLRLDESLTIDRLVPGVDVPVIATINGRNVSRVQRFQELTVTETAAGESVGGTIITRGGEINE